MCLVVFALDVAPQYSLLFAANRDERHARPSHAAAWWPDAPQVFGGRDLVANGSWLAVDRSGKIAAVTNFRAPGAPPALKSRGALVGEYVAGHESLADYAHAVAEHAHDFGPFSLLLFDGNDARYLSNRAPLAQLARGVHALSNAALGVEWPKTQTARAGLSRLLGEPAPVEALFALLSERGEGQTADERYRSAHFVAGPLYGTRSSTVILVDRSGVLTFAERTFDADTRLVGEVRETITLPQRSAT
jgi:uncharacterized protein with NRDE domain